MPISQSAKKSLRVSEHKTSVNRYRKARLKEATRKVTAETLPAAVSMIDKAAKWKLIHPRKAARWKSRLSVEFANAAPVAAPKKATKAAGETKPKKAVAKKASVKKAAPKAKK
jgi:small subunit ribosomal protein S20